MEKPTGKAVEQISLPKFDFAYKTIEDKQALRELLDCVRLSDPKPDAGNVRLMHFHEKALTPLGVEVLESLVEKAVVIPCVYVEHEYSYKSERREYVEQEEKFKRPKKQYANYKGWQNSEQRSGKGIYDDVHEIFGDVWDDKKFFSQMEINKKEEDDQPHYFIECPTCEGHGDGGTDYEDVKYKDDCPNCGGTGKEGIYVCPRCDGRGWTFHHRQRRVEGNCPKCGGYQGKGVIVIAKRENEKGKECKRTVLTDPGIPRDYLELGAAADEIVVAGNTVETPPFHIVGFFEEVGNRTLSWLIENKLLKQVIDAEHIKGTEIKRIIEFEGLAKSVQESLEIDLEKSDVSGNDTRIEYCGDEKVKVYIGICAVRFTFKVGDETHDIWWCVLENFLAGLESQEWLGAHDGRSQIAPSELAQPIQDAIKQAEAKGIRKMPEPPKVTKVNPKQSKNVGAPTGGKNCKRWKFVLLGLLFGWFGAHYMCAKRWLMLLLTLGSFATGVVMMNKSESNQQEVPVQTEQQTEGNASKGNSEAIGAVCLVLWLVMWLGGALFVKKDGKGNRM